MRFTHLSIEYNIGNGIIQEEISKNMPTENVRSSFCLKGLPQPLPALWFWSIPRF